MHVDARSVIASEGRKNVATGGVRRSFPPTAPSSLFPDNLQYRRCGGVIPKHAPPTAGLETGATQSYPHTAATSSLNRCAASRTPGAQSPSLGLNE